MKKMTLYLAIICLFLSSIVVNAKEKVIIATGEWPPYISKDLKYFGCVSRIVEESFNSEGYEVEFKFYPWSRAFEMVKNGTIDATSVWGSSAEREQFTIYSDYVIQDEMFFFHLKSFKFDWKNMNDMKNIKIGGTQDYNYGEDFNKAVTDGLIKVSWANQDILNFRKLLVGRINVFPCEATTGKVILSKNFTKEEVELFTYHPQVLRRVTYHLLFSKKLEKNNELVKIFNTGIDKLKKSGKAEIYVNEALRGEYNK